MKTRILSLQDEIQSLAGHPESYRNQIASRLQDLQQLAISQPGSWIQKIVWDKADGYPEHAWGFVQYTLRPYRQGYGCDGTTDSNIHLIAKVMAEREGWDYQDIYQQAYPGDPFAWINDLASEPNLSETVIPRKSTAKAWATALNDLYQINNRSLERVLEEMVMDRYPDIVNFLSL